MRGQGLKSQMGWPLQTPGTYRDPKRIVGSLLGKRSGLSGIIGISPK